MFGFIKNSSKNRVFCDAMIRKIAVEILLSGEIDEQEKIASYSKYEAEFKTGLHGGFKFVPISDKIKPKEMLKLKEFVKQGYDKNFENIYELRNYLMEKLEIDDDYLHPLNEPDNLSYTFMMAKKRE